MIAVSHPGKLGDALYALPAVRWLCDRYQAQADFYTSAYCRPLGRFLEYQSCIRRVVVLDSYRPARFDMGVQPWEMPLPEGDYDATYHLGFRTCPDRPLHDFIRLHAGIQEQLPIRYEYPDCPTLEEPYVVLAPRGRTSYRDTFVEFARHCHFPVVEVGAGGEALGVGTDRTGLDMLEMAAWIAKARGFVGLQSAPLVIANGFPVPKLIPHDGLSWDMRHAVQGPYNHYRVNPSGLEIAQHFDYLPGYCKTLDPLDYRFLTTETPQVDRAVGLLQGVPHRFEHPHRQWEYALALQAITRRGARTVLDVGGGGSAFAPSLALAGLRVTQLDPGACAGWVAAQSLRIGRPLPYRQEALLGDSDPGQYDAVTCLSVIEHVPDDHAFFQGLLRRVQPGGVLALTTDFHPSGQPRCAGHLRTYTAESLAALARGAAGFEGWGHLDYPDRGAHVHGYNFASLVLRRGT